MTLSWKLSRGACIGVVIVGACLLALPPAQAHLDDEHGWLSVHDTPTSPDSDQTNRLVECLFWVRGHAVTHANGTLTGFTSGSFGFDQAELGEWTGTPNGDGTFSFLAGPFSLEDTVIGSGESWFIFGTMWDADEHTITSPYFRWSSCEENDGPECPGDVSVTASEEGNAISWTYRENGGEFRIYRDGGRIAVVDGEERAYLDGDVEEGQTYTYRVTFASDIGESEGCADVVTTAVPFFGGPMAMALAALGSVGALAVIMRRKRA